MDGKPRELSGGQRRHVALGRVIVRRPEVFLFDEPLSNLDAVLRDQTRSELKRLHQELDTTSVYVTHDQEEAMTLSDAIAVMSEGRLEQYGTPEEIYRRPATEFVASFVSKRRMNLMDAVVDKQKTLSVPVLGSPQKPHPICPSRFVSASGQKMYGFRESWLTGRNFRQRFA